MIQFETFNEGLCWNLDLLDEVKVVVEQWMAWYQNLMAKHYNTHVKPKYFYVGELVLKKVMIATKDPTQGKLGPN